MFFTGSSNTARMRKASRILGLLSNPGRLAIVDLLLDRKRLSVNEISEALELGQSNTSQHLKVMEDVGLLTSEREGKHIYYTVSNPGLTQLLNCVNNCCEVPAQT